MRILRRDLPIPYPRMMQETTKGKAKIEMKEDLEKKNTIRELEFTIFCIESLAEALHQDGATVYQALSRGKNLIKNYIIPEYEVLHTQGKDYIVEELLRVMKDWGE